MSTAGTRTQRRDLSVPKDWLADEEKYLKENYGVKSYREMGLELGRTPGAVKGKAKRMKLCGTAEFRKLEENECEGQGKTPILTRHVLTRYVLRILKINRSVTRPYSVVDRCKAHNHYILRRAAW